MSYMLNARTARIGALEFSEDKVGRSAFGLQTLEAEVPSGEGATVIPGATIAFGDGISSELRSDLEDALLLSSMAADMKASRRSPSREWYDEYISWLETCGFLVTSQVFQRRAESNEQVELAKEALEIIGSIASGAGALTVLTKTLDVLAGQADDDGQISLFESRANFAGDGAFQLGEVVASGDTRVTIPIGLFAFRSTSVRRKFLFFSWEADAIELFASASNVIFNQDEYATVRDLVQQKIAKKKRDRLSRLTF